MHTIVIGSISGSMRGRRGSAMTSSVRPGSEPADRYRRIAMPPSRRAKTRGHPRQSPIRGPRLARGTTGGGGGAPREGRRPIWKSTPRTSIPTDRHRMATWPILWCQMTKCRIRRMKTRTTKCSDAEEQGEGPIAQRTGMTLVMREEAMTTTGVAAAQRGLAREGTRVTMRTTMRTTMHLVQADVRAVHAAA